MPKTLIPVFHIWLMLQIFHPFMSVQFSLSSVYLYSTKSQGAVIGLLTHWTYLPIYNLPILYYLQIRNSWMITNSVLEFSLKKWHNAFHCFSWQLFFGDASFESARRSLKMLFFNAAVILGKTVVGGHGTTMCNEPTIFLPLNWLLCRWGASLWPHTVSGSLQNNFGLSGLQIK